MISTRLISGDLLQSLAQTRAETDELFKVVRTEFLYDRPIPERHRIVFYVGHLEAFDWNLLRGALGLEPFDAGFDRLFAFGIDPVGGNLPTDEPADWPSLSEIRSYGNQVRELLDRRLAEPWEAGVGDEELTYLLNIAIEHRQMHAETLAYIFHQMPFEKKMAGSAGGGETATGVFAPVTVEIPGGAATLGLSRKSGRFGWDNEFDAHIARVPAFNIDKYKVTNGEFLDFVEAGGYDDSRWWSAEDWEWRRDQSIDHPAFWFRKGDAWFWRSMVEGRPLPLDWPVYVSHAEASAYARWKGRALPTEAQWHRAAYGTYSGDETEYPWGNEPPPGPANGVFDPSAVQSGALGMSAFGVAGLLANGWEWTATTFAPFEGFRPVEAYAGYSAPFFDGKHYVLKGGSVRTASGMLRRSFRNWFQPHYQYVYAGFRTVCASDQKS